MDDVIKSLTPEQALEVLKRLSEKGGAHGEAVLSEAKDLLSEAAPDQTAEEVFFALDTIDVQDCWDRSGRSRHGYTYIVVQRRPGGFRSRLPEWNADWTDRTDRHGSVDSRP